MIKKLIVYHHLGLGDHFICNGLIHELLENRAHEIWLPTKENNAVHVKHLYEDFSEQVKIITTNENDLAREILGINSLSIQYNVPLLRISHGGGKDTYFDKIFYDQLGIDFHIRWSRFTLPQDDSRALEFYKKIIPDPEEPYVLVHDTGSVGKFDLKFNSPHRIVKVESGLTESLLDWKYVIERASEPHCIDSSVIHLADSLSLDAGLLVFHDVGRNSKFNFNHSWEIQRY